jgi:hypothetical protein
MKKVIQRALLLIIMAIPSLVWAGDLAGNSTAKLMALALG